MSAQQPSKKWSNLASCPSTNYMTSPTGRDRNTYIVIDNSNYCIYKYNIENDKWIEIDFDKKPFNVDTAALDVKKEILYLFDNKSVTQIQLNNNHINNDNHNE
eukprot:371481_1